MPNYRHFSYALYFSRDIKTTHSTCLGSLILMSRWQPYQSNERFECGGWMLYSTESAILICSCYHIGRLIECAAIIIIYGLADIVIVNTNDSIKVKLTQSSIPYILIAVDNGLSTFSKRPCLSRFYEDFWSVTNNVKSLILFRIFFFSSNWVTTKALPSHCLFRIHFTIIPYNFHFFKMKIVEKWLTGVNHYILMIVHW